MEHIWKIQIFKPSHSEQLCTLKRIFPYLFFIFFLCFFLSLIYLINLNSCSCWWPVIFMDILEAQKYSSSCISKSVTFMKAQRTKHEELILPCSKPDGLSRSHWSIKASLVLTKKTRSLPSSKLMICSPTTTFSPEPLS